MSFEAMAWAVKWDLPVKQKITLLMLANRINPDTDRCFPSIRGLARDCGMSETSVREALRSLKEAGLVIAHERRIDGVSLSNEYEVVTSKFPPPLRHTHHPPAPHAVPPLRHTHPKLSLETITEPNLEGDGLFSQEGAESEEPESLQFEAFWKAFPTKQNSSKKNAKVRYATAVRKVSADDLLRAAKAYAASREGEDPKFTKAAEFWLSGEFWEPWLKADTIDPDRARLRAITEAANAAQRRP